ncbi:MAG: hypothetical protein KME16_22290 [Scytolyngbya sp. HA4215-MV1]|jgi:hypothetical protein|nr:hypothetical protein [Scytolyngbya sp. HA4215-MV1]
MSYIAEIKGSIPQAKHQIISQELPVNPSTIELFSYAFCCATQGLLWVAYIALIAFVPIALSQGIFSIGS